MRKRPYYDHRRPDKAERDLECLCLFLAFGPGLVILALTFIWTIQ